MRSFAVLALSLAIAAGASDAGSAAVEPDGAAWATPARARAAIEPCTKTAVNDQDFSRRCTDRYVRACEKAGNDTTVAMSTCTSAAYVYWKGVVAQRTNALLARHRPPLSNYLNATRDDWQRYIKARCGMYALLQGTMWGPVSDACALDITLGRAEDLHTLALNYS